jgi:hypothetical protein
MRNTQPHGERTPTNRFNQKRVYLFGQDKGQVFLTDYRPAGYVLVLNNKSQICEITSSVILF